MQVIPPRQHDTDFPGASHINTVYGDNVSVGKDEDSCATGLVKDSPRTGGMEHPLTMFMNIDGSIHNINRYPGMLSLIKPLRSAAFGRFPGPLVWKSGKTPTLFVSRMEMSSGQLTERCYWREAGQFEPLLSSDSATDVPVGPINSHFLAKCRWHTNFSLPSKLKNGMHQLLSLPTPRVLYLELQTSPRLAEICPDLDYLHTISVLPRRPSAGT
ncbi:hypothetical protein ACRALDRAFT_211495 [Sodiomyces alcalophilus JCM 7366]|uniref:uncharacterized protein n=1 Tax=Sodiomyces alcalophilus JCM 7366 TaxID=591952 RepID=UPI0039B653B5